MVKIQEIEVKSVMTKSNLPVADFSVNPYVGCLHGCKYCYASFRTGLGLRLPMYIYMNL